LAHFLFPGILTAGPHWQGNEEKGDMMTFGNFKKQPGLGRWLSFSILGVCGWLVALGSTTAMAAMTVVGSSYGRDCYLSASMGGDSDAEIQSCRMALVMERLGDRDRAATLVNLGILLTHAARHDEAITSFDAAEKINPRLTEAMINRGNSYIHQREFLLAIEEYDRSLQLGTSRRAEAFANRGLAHEYVADYLKAATDYACALAHREGFPKVDRGLSRVRVKGVEIPECPVELVVRNDND
jgi:tetratricopeptide (TPR) repeat protein